MAFRHNIVPHFTRCAYVRVVLSIRASLIRLVVVSLNKLLVHFVPKLKKPGSALELDLMLNLVAYP